MQFIKKLVIQLSLISLTLMMFFIGLGIAVFATIALLIARLFVKPQSHKVLQEKWAKRQAEYKSRYNTRDVIDGQYTVIDNH